MRIIVCNIQRICCRVGDRASEACPVVGFDFPCAFDPGQIRQIFPIRNIREPPPLTQERIITKRCIVADVIREIIVAYIVAEETGAVLIELIPGSIKRIVGVHASKLIPDRAGESLRQCIRQQLAQIRFWKITGRKGCLRRSLEQGIGIKCTGKVFSIHIQRISGQPIAVGITIQKHSGIIEDGIVERLIQLSTVALVTI